MNIKNCTNLIRSILYAQEVIRCKSINKAAEENNIKASNLSVIITNLEKQIGSKLIKRSPTGCTPTKQGCQLSEYAEELQQQIKKISLWHEKIYPHNRTLNIYISPNMELNDYHQFEQEHPNIKLNFIDEEILADIKIINHPPLNQNESYTELNIGQQLKQKIWICCNEHNPKALDFFDFIIAKLLLLYDQPKP